MEFYTEKTFNVVLTEKEANALKKDLASSHNGLSPESVEFLNYLDTGLKGY